MKKIILVLGAVIAAAGAITATTWSTTINNPTWGTEHTLYKTSLTPHYVPGADSLTSELFSVDYSNSGNSSSGTSSIETNVNEPSMGVVTFDNSKETIQLALLTNTFADLSANGVIDVHLTETGNHEFNISSAHSSITGTRLDSVVNSVPEPNTMLLLSFGLLVITIYFKRRRNM